MKGGKAPCPLEEKVGTPPLSQGPHLFSTRHVRGGKGNDPHEGIPSTSPCPSSFETIGKGAGWGASPKGFQVDWVGGIEGGNGKKILVPGSSPSLVGRVGAQEGRKPTPTKDFPAFGGKLSLLKERCNFPVKEPCPLARIAIREGFTLLWLTRGDLSPVPREGKGRREEGFKG